MKLTQDQKQDIILRAKVITVGALVVYTFLLILFTFFSDPVDNSDNKKGGQSEKNDYSGCIKARS